MPKRKNDNPGFPVAAQNVYKFDNALDEATRAQMLPQFGADPMGGVVRKDTFIKRRDAQINKRKKMGY